MYSPDFITEAKKKYVAIHSPVFCSCLNRNINFTSDGFMHLIKKGDGKPRTIQEIKYKTKPIPLIVPVIKNATDASYEKRLVRKNSKKNAPIVLAEYWGLEANVGKSNVSVRVIIRRVGDGQAHFWSVM
jgi:hypothetical protein